MRSVFVPGLVMAALAFAALPASAARILVASVDATGALPPATWRSVQDVVAGAVSRAGHDVVTPQQLEALIGLEAARQLVGCTDERCVSRMHGELGGALGVDGVITVNVSAAGSGLVVAVKRVGTAGGGRVADARLKQKKVDAVLDALPALVGEVLEALSGPATPGTPPTTPTPGTTTPTPAVSRPGLEHLPAGCSPRPSPAARAQRALSLASEVKEQLKVVDDGAGRVIVYSAAAPLDGPFLAGTVKGGVFAQRVIGGGSQGDVAFDLTFWDARFSRGAERGFALKDGAFSLTCGPATTTYKPASAATTKAALAKVFDVAWQRHVMFIARDDDLTWYIVDDDLKDGDDFVLWVGRKVDGRFRFSPVSGELVRDGTFGDGVLLVAPGLKVKVGPGGGEVIRGADKTPLSVQDLYAQAGDVYGVMRPWGDDVALGTPCD